MDANGTGDDAFSIQVSCTFPTPPLLLLVPASSASYTDCHSDVLLCTNATNAIDSGRHFNCLSGLMDYTTMLPCLPIECSPVPSVRHRASTFLVLAPSGLALSLPIGCISAALRTIIAGHAHSMKYGVIVYNPLWPAGYPLPTQ